ncbi:MAG: acylphosphatase [Gemmatimonadetes bacterium]|nr:acylphosphatase [Gemmatimonadota bacterium]
MTLAVLTADRPARQWTGAAQGAGTVQYGYRVTGEVQGVGFRWWTCRLARALGIRGAVRNRIDGSVEIHAAGAPEAMSDFEAHLRQGPPGAVVGTVERFDSTLPLPENDFVIVR